MTSNRTRAVVAPSRRRRGPRDWRYEESDKPSDSGLFANAADDDRANIATGDRVLLVVENDLAFARVLLAGARAPASRDWSPPPAPAR